MAVRQWASRVCRGVVGSKRVGSRWIGSVDVQGSQSLLSTASKYKTSVKGSFMYRALVIVGLSCIKQDPKPCRKSRTQQPSRFWNFSQPFSETEVS